MARVEPRAAHVLLPAASRYLQAHHSQVKFLLGMITLLSNVCRFLTPIFVNQGLALVSVGVLAPTKELLIPPATVSGPVQTGLLFSLVIWILAA